MNDAELTVATVRARGWQVVKLRGKRPIGTHWEITADADQVARWISAGHNIGLVCGPCTGVVVLDEGPRNGVNVSLASYADPLGPVVHTGGPGSPADCSLCESPLRAPCCLPTRRRDRFFLGHRPVSPRAL